MCTFIEQIYKFYILLSEMQPSPSLWYMHRHHEIWFVFLVLFYWIFVFKWKTFLTVYSLSLLFFPFRTSTKCRNWNELQKKFNQQWIKKIDVLCTHIKTSFHAASLLPQCCMPLCAYCVVLCCVASYIVYFNGLPVWTYI